MILAPGGGWITVPRVVEQRMGPNRGLRPLLATPDPLAALSRLLEHRGALYEAAADLAVVTEQLDLQGVTEQIANWISLFAGNSVMPGGKQDR
jgi:shikimate kinase